MTANIKFAKVRADAKIPNKRDEDMGFDIYACFDEDYMMIPPHETMLIPTGIASSCDPEYGFVLRERGSTGSKGIALRAGVIDSGYRNEWFVALTNTTSTMLFITKLSEEQTKEQWVNYSLSEHTFANNAAKLAWEDSEKMIVKHSTFYPYSKAIAQALVIPVPKVKVEEITYEELQMIPSERGIGKLGSSNK